MRKTYKGVLIPARIMANKKLTPTDKILYSFIEQDTYPDREYKHIKNSLSLILSMTQSDVDASLAPLAELEMLKLGTGVTESDITITLL